MRTLRSGLLRLMKRGPGTAELEAELRAHLEMDVDAQVQAGAQAAEAERQARVRLGGAGPTRERVVDQRGLPWLDDAWQDVRYGVRMLWRYPAVSLLSVLVLAGGIATVTAMVGFSRQVLSAAAPPVDLSRRIRVWSSAPNQREHRTVVSPEDYVAFAERSRSVAAWAAVRRRGFNFSGLDSLLRVSALKATPGLFEVMGVTTGLGRPFTEADLAPGAQPTAARIRLGDEGDGRWRTIVGVVADVRNDDIDAPPLPHVYVPLAQRPERTMTLVVRSRPGSVVPLPALQAAVSSVDRDQPVYALRTLDDVLAEDLAGTQALPGLLGAFAVGALLLAAAGTYSVIAFGVSRRRSEIALRLALGASRRTVAWLVTRQGLVPVLAGVLFGLAGALALARVGGSFLYGVTPGDPVSYAASAIVLGGAGLLAAVSPALRAMRVAPLQSLREG